MPMMPPTFRAHGARTDRDRNREADAKRGSARKRGYGTAWDKAAVGHRRRYPLCRGCEAIGRVEAATLTDHVEPHRGDQAVFWDSVRWQSSCDWHHSVVKQKLEAMYARGEISPSDLWLDSPVAVSLAKSLMPAL